MMCRKEVEEKSECIDDWDFGTVRATQNIDTSPGTINDNEEFSHLSEFSINTNSSFLQLTHEMKKYSGKAFYEKHFLPVLVKQKQSKYLIHLKNAFEEAEKVCWFCEYV